MEAKRSEKDVKLIAVSKLQSIEVIKEAYSLGINHFGENYAQELDKKVLATPKDIVWHFIGPIQSNKVKLIAKHAHWIHSLEREKIAKKLNDELEKLKKTIDENNNLYESMLDKTTQSLEKIILNTESLSKIQ